MSNRGLLLGWDTTSPKGSLALVEKGEVLSSLQIKLGKRPTTRLFNTLDRMFTIVGREKSELVGMALLRGPGSFTGIRTAIAVAKGLALSLNLSLISFSSLEAMALSLPLEGKILCPLLNARRGQLYGALFRWVEGVLERLVPDVVMDVDRWVMMKDKVLFLGEVVRDLDLKGIYTLPPRAQVIALAAWEMMDKGEVEDPQTLRPLYIRASDAEVTRGIKVLECA